jgi:cytochrome c biogenesis factor
MRDLYASLVTVDAEASSATLRFYVNPGIGLLWLGALVIALGGVTAAWPSRARRSPPPVAERAAEQREEVPV